MSLLVLILSPFYSNSPHFIAERGQWLWTGKWNEEEEEEGRTELITYL